ncbi:unnamed protein product [Penicillium discolor]
MLTSSRLPLDLTSAEVVAHPVMREAAISKLDAKGWNTKEIIKEVTWSRVTLLLGHVRELVLEIYLDCQNVQELSMPSATTLLR